jgi:hypothetical protein
MGGEPRRTHSPAHRRLTQRSTRGTVGGRGAGVAAQLRALIPSCGTGVRRLKVIFRDRPPNTPPPPQWESRGAVVGENEPDHHDPNGSRVGAPTHISTHTTTAGGGGAGMACLALTIQTVGVPAAGCNGDECCCTRPPPHPCSLPSGRCFPWGWFVSYRARGRPRPALQTHCRAGR